MAPVANPKLLTSWSSLQVIADVFLSLLVKKEDYHRSLRGLFREIVRQMKHNFSYSVFTRQMMQENRDPMFQQLDQPAKVREVTCVHMSGSSHPVLVYLLLLMGCDVCAGCVGADCSGGR